MFLTHKYVEMTLHKFPLQTLLDDLISFSVTRDDVADHEKWSKRFRCDRILHSKDVQSIYAFMALSVSSLAISVSPMNVMITLT